MLARADIRPSRTLFYPSASVRSAIQKGVGHNIGIYCTGSANFTGRDGDDAGMKEVGTSEKVQNKRLLKGQRGWEGERGREGGRDGLVEGGVKGWMK